MVMSQTRVFVEWLFNEVKTYFKFVSLKSQVRIGRSSHRRCSVREDVPRNFAKLKGKHLCQSLFFNKVAGLIFLQNTSGCLLLDRTKCSRQNLLCMCLTSKCRNMFIQDMGIKFLSFSSSFAQVHLLFFLHYNV